jgi:hypothetical protein
MKATLIAALLMASVASQANELNIQSCYFGIHPVIFTRDGWNNVLNKEYPVMYNPRVWTPMTRISDNLFQIEVENLKATATLKAGKLKNTFKRDHWSFSKQVVPLQLNSTLKHLYQTDYHKIERFAYDRTKGEAYRIACDLSDE